MDAAMSSAITSLTAAVPALDAGTAKAALVAAVPIPVRGAARFRIVCRPIVISTLRILSTNVLLALTLDAHRHALHFRLASRCG